MIFTPEAIKSRLQDRPFQPLRIITSSGQQYDVYHPDLVMVGNSSAIIGLPGKGTPQFFENVSRVALAHITDLQDLTSPIGAVEVGTGGR